MSTPSQDSSNPHEAGPGPRGFFAPLLRSVRYPDLYCWYLLFASLDIMVTWVILRLGGNEVNGLANWIIQRYDLIGMVVFKFATVVTVVALCEAVGRRRPQSGERLGKWSVILTAFPVVVGTVHLVRFALDQVSP